MSNKKLFFVLVVLLALLGVGIFASTWGATILLGNQSNALAILKAQNQATANQQAQLAEDKKAITTYADLNNIAKSVVPQDKDEAEAVREIVNLASQSGLHNLSSITFPTSTLGGTPAKAGGGLTQVTPVKSIPGVYDLQITITQANTSLVPYSSFAAFLAKLEQNRRTAQVSSISIQPDAKNPSQVAFTLIIDEFIKP
ncbi:MAG TPA: hypothetical protein VNG90_03080 [Candidatus Acidoferrum sp.]|nr:hypothetical protein [Candidatus Acidoferrum sp.]